MGRGLIALAIAILAFAPLSMAETPTDAEVHFDRGVELSKKGDHEGALVEFRAAYEAEPHFKVRYNIGVSLYRLNRYLEAKEELEAYLLEGGEDIPEARETEVKAILFEITSYIGSLVVVCDMEGAQVLVDGQPVGLSPLPGPIPIDVGEHDVQIEKEGFEPVATTVSVPGGTVTHVELALGSGGTPVTPPDKPLNLSKATGRKLFWAGEALSIFFILAIPVASVFYIVEEMALQSYMVPNVAWGGVASTAMVLGAQTIAASSLKKLGVKETKASLGLRIAGWVFWGGTVLLLGGHYLIQGLYNYYDANLEGCTEFECSGTRKFRNAFAIATYFMSGALAGAFALTWALGTAGWVFVTREVEMASPRVALAPWLTAVPGGAMLGASGVF